jgi:uncharacterized damage-inducible protein DinB
MRVSLQIDVDRPASTPMAYRIGGTSTGIEREPTEETEAMVTIKELIQELDQESRSTRRVLERVKPDKLDWRPHEKSLSLGQLAMHVATLPRAIAEMSTQATFDAGTPIPRPSAPSTDVLLATMEQSVGRAREILNGMDDAALNTPWRMMKGSHEIMVMPRANLLRTVLFNHWYHHRGQLIVYLRLTGALVPGIYGDSADEKPFSD